MTRFPFRHLLPTAFCLILFWVFTFFFAIPLLNTPVFAQFCGPGSEPCTDAAGNPFCVAIGSCPGSGGGGGGGPGGGVGTIRPPAGFGIPTTNDPQTFVASLVRNGIALMIIIAFVVDLIWTILAGYRFILAQGDPKTISAAWSQIYWGLIGLLVIMGSFAIIRMAETFFNVDIIKSGLRLPTRLTP